MSTNALHPKIYIIHGMKRSGNHAIVDWIRAHGNFAFFNNESADRSIWKGKTTLTIPGNFDEWLQSRMFLHSNSIASLFKRFIIKDRRLIISVEYKNLSYQPYTESGEAINILIIRDPYNLISSRIRKSHKVNSPKIYPRNFDPSMRRIVTRWKEHAKEYLGDSNNLQNKVCVFYNNWFSDIDYRRILCQQLQLGEFTDAGFNIVSKIGGGSSFDGTDFDGGNGRMEVLKRYLQLSGKEISLFNEVFRDLGLRKLALEVSGICYPNLN